MNAEEWTEKLKKLSPEDLAELSADLQSKFSGQKFIPNPGPQYDALHSKADIMLFGGSAGSGKSALLCGTAITQHRRSLILRRKYSDLSALTEELVKVNGTKEGFVGSPHPKLTTADGRLIEFGACQHPGDEESFQGRAHDLKCFDEVTQFLESQVRYIIGWTRPGPGVPSDQRCRVIFASNPPTSATGEWIIGFFRPWLDPAYDKPAKPGELRWCVTDPDGRDMWVDGPDPVQFPGRKEPSLPKSRTFIPGKLTDNPYLKNSGYAATLDSLPEPLRSALRDGNFMLARKDDARQVIPSEWVKQAMSRWNTHRPAGVPMSAMGVDVSCGGEDNTVIAMRYDGWFDKLVTVPGKKIKDGRDVAGIVLSHRRNNATVVMDMGGGYGGSPKEHLEENGIDVYPYKGNTTSDGKSRERMGFSNTRTEAYWKFREALDPAQHGGSTISLPDDPQLLAELTAPTFDLVSKGYKIETKEDVCTKLGRSPDKADAVVMAWFKGPRGVAPNHPGQHFSSHNKPKPKVLMGRSEQRNRR